MDRDEYGDIFKYISRMATDGVYADEYIIEPLAVGIKCQINVYRCANDAVENITRYNVNANNHAKLHIAHVPAISHYCSIESAIK